VDRSDSEHRSVSIEELNPFPNSNTKKGEASFKKKKDALSIEDEALNKQASSFAETPKVGKGDQNDASKIAEQFTNMISKKRPALDGIRLSDEKSVSIKAVPGSTKNGRLAQVPAISIQNRPKIDRRRSAIMYGLLVMNWLRKKRVLPAFKILSKFRKWKQLGFRSMRNLIFRKDPGLIKDPSSSARRLSLPRRPNLATMLRR
jgi:hypothetical protein